MASSNSGKLDARRGLFVTFEGGDGSGKSTNIAFAASLLEKLGIPVLLVREPGGTAIGERIRDVILDVESDGMSPRTELLLYEAARAQLMDDVILPALEDGMVVLSDRFTDSTIAYQGAGRGIDRDAIIELNGFATESVAPDLTIMLRCSDRQDKRDRVARREHSDRLEDAGTEFHSRVLSEYDRIASEEPDRIMVIDSSKPHSETARSIIDALSARIPALSDPRHGEAIDEAIIAYASEHPRSAK